MMTWSAEVLWTAISGLDVFAADCCRLCHCQLFFERAVVSNRKYALDSITIGEMQLKKLKKHPIC